MFSRRNCNLEIYRKKLFNFLGVWDRKRRFFFCLGSQVGFFSSFFFLLGHSTSTDTAAMRTLTSPNKSLKVGKLSLNFVSKQQVHIFPLALITKNAINFFRFKLKVNLIIVRFVNNLIDPAIYFFTINHIKSW